MVRSLYNKIVIGNWKMNTTSQEAYELTEKIVHQIDDTIKKNVKIVLCPPLPYLQKTKSQIKDKLNMAVGGQNCSNYISGAYTGEVSASMLKSLGVSYVIIGHSERRHYFLEKGKLLSSKVSTALSSGLYPIYCCGEPLAIRETNKEKNFICTQIEEGLFHLDNKSIQNTVIAYEPIWAIGSGKPASLQQIQEIHTTIRHHIASKFGVSTAHNIPLLYGGSLKASNAAKIFGCANVDGGLIGGASLKAEEFIRIVHAI